MNSLWRDLRFAFRLFRKNPEHFQEMAATPCGSIEGGDEHDIDAMSPSICQQLIEARSFRFRS
jgi:hypothetical protein